MNKDTVPLNVTVHDCFDPSRETQPCGIIIFGASGDLAHRKLFPALYDLYYAKHLPENFFLVGSARTKWNDNIFRERILRIFREKQKPDPVLQNKFIEHIYYHTAEYSDPNSLKFLSEMIKELSIKYKSNQNLILYFATSSDVYSDLIVKLADIGLITKANCGEPWVHAVFEKPFGHDLKSARTLNKTILNVLDETQIYRIDHYLGKETVQNILLFRFANTIFEPLWNKEYVDHVQITASEVLGVEHRAGYYDKSGQLRDMFQNHMFQLLTLVAMEAPVRFAAQQYHNEKVKLARAIRHIPKAKIGEYVVLGQYGEGIIDGKKVHAYRQEEGVPPHSTTETFAAIKVLIDNPRWEGVPFYLRSGKRLNHPMTEIAIHFKKPQHLIYKNLKLDQLDQNVLSFRIQPDEGIFLSFDAKKPGPKLSLASMNFGFNYKDIFKTPQMGPYERLLLDCIRGDQMLFVREDMVEVSWKFIDSILKEHKKLMPQVLPNYASGSWGPEEANKLIQRDGRRWQDF